MSEGTHPATNIRLLPIVASLGRPLLPFSLREPRATEAYRKLRTQLLLAEPPRRVVAVTSASGGDGKTLTSANLACSFALHPDIEVVVVDADLRSGNLDRTFGLPEGPGLGDYLAGHCRFEDAIVQTAQLPNLYLMTAGTYRRNPVELLDSRIWRELIAFLRASFRMVLIDVPPIGELADYEIAQHVCDGVLMVVRENHTSRTAMHRALRAIPKSKLLGVVLNGSDGTNASATLS